jgi:hypothetical protein
MKTGVRTWGVSIVVYLSTVVACGSAQGIDRSGTIDRDGLNFSAGGTFCSSISSSGRGYFTSVGMGYGIAAHVDLVLRIYNGDMTFPGEPRWPLSVRSAFAGGGIELSYFPGRQSVWSPYISCGVDLITAADSNDAANFGCRGYGLHASLGIEYALSEAFGAAGAFSFWNLRFSDLVGTAPDNAQLIGPIRSDFVSFSFVLRYYP